MLLLELQRFLYKSCLSIAVCIWHACQTFLQDYLQRFYDLQTEPSGRSKRSSLSFTSKVKDMQIFFGLNVTGSLDPDTLEVMKSPRCGVPDVEDYIHGQGARWGKNVITYRLNASALLL